MRFLFKFTFSYLTKIFHTLAKLLSEKIMDKGGKLTVSKVFIQDGPCYEFPNYLTRCLECKTSRTIDTSCRFLAFRRFVES